MNDEEKLGFIAEKLEREQEALPVSLEKGNIVRRLQNVEVKKKKKSYVYIKRATALAAALAVTFTAVYASGVLKKFDKSKYNNAENKLENYTPENYRIPNDYDYSDIENYFIGKYRKNVENSTENYYYVGSDGSYNGSADEPSVTVPAVEALYSTDTNTTFSIKGSADHSTTNIQVSGVDEGDIIKNDGRYLYIVTGKRVDNESEDMSYIKNVKIIDTAEMKVVSSVPLPKASEKTEYDVKEIYLQGSKLTVVIDSYDRMDTDPNTTVGCAVDGDIVYISSCCLPIYRNQKTTVAVYDTENKNEPKLISQKTQDGAYESSRMVGSVLYTVSFYNVDLAPDLDESDVKKNCVPTVNGERIALPAITIDKEDNDEIRKYIVVTATDTDNEKLSGASAAYLLGDFNNMYSTAETLYITAYEYCETGSYENRYKTKIVSFSLSEDEITLTAKGSVPGMLDDRYSMDEYGGYFRIFTTDYSNSTFRNESSLYVLDASSLKTVGSLVDIAENEEIKSARFMGNIAYVVTYENTDPLFVIDLSSPEKPTISGQVKLPGFSEYLHPLSDGLLLGVGYGGNDEGADFRKIKLTLFDVTDMKKPKELSSFTIEDAYSSVNYDPKAFLSFDENTFAIPVQKYVKSSNYAEKAIFSLAVFEIKDNEISLKNNFQHPDDDYTAFFRGAFIGETVYTVTDSVVASHSIKSGEMTDKVSIG